MSRGQERRSLSPVRVTTINDGRTLATRRPEHTTGQIHTAEVIPSRIQTDGPASVQRGRLHSTKGREETEPVFPDVGCRLVRDGVSLRSRQEEVTPDRLLTQYDEFSVNVYHSLRQQQKDRKVYFSEKQKGDRWTNVLK